MISLKFYGYDYSKMSDSLEESLVVDFIKGDGSIEQKILNKKEQIKIICKFLDDIDDIKKYVIETQTRHTNKKKYKLYKKTEKEDDDEKDEYSLYSWNGFVGILQGIVELTNIDLYDKNNRPTDVYGYEPIKVILQIQSRFDRNEDNVYCPPYFLSTMLLQCQTGLNEELVPSNDKDFFFDLFLLYMFKERAKKCYQKGLYRTYRRFEKNDDRIKGAIDVSRHIRLNMGLNNGKIAYSYRENTIDNYLNHLILCAFEKMKKKYPSCVNMVYSDPNNCEFRRFVDELKANLGFSQIDSRTIISKNQKTISHPYYIEYEDLRKISIRILRDEGLSIFDGDGEDSNGLLVYIPDLWELYLEKLLTDSNYILYTQGLMKSGDKKDSPIRIFNYASDSTEFVQKTYPDYVFADKGNAYFMVLDAKFKPAWSATIFKRESLGTGKMGLMNDYDKCIRDMNSLNVYATGTIFPTNNDDNIDDFIEHNISGYNSIHRFYTFPIYVPFSNKDNYSEWYNSFRDSLDPIIVKIKGIAFKEMNIRKKCDAAIELANENIINLRKQYSKQLYDIGGTL